MEWFKVVFIAALTLLVFSLIQPTAASHGHDQAIRPPRSPPPPAPPRPAERPPPPPRPPSGPNPRANKRAN